MKRHNHEVFAARRWVGILIVSLAIVFTAASAPQQQQIQYGEQPGAAQRTTLLLRDFQPR